MADPYATRLRPAPLSGPGGDPEWLGEIAARGGLVVSDIARLPAEDEAAEAAFVVVPCADLGIVPPLARVGPELAAAFLIARSAAPTAEQAASALHLFRRTSRNPPYSDDSGTFDGIFLVKQGLVAGPVDRPGARPVDAGMVARLLDAVAAGKVEWEPDPNLGWQTPIAAADFGGEELDALTPRFLYARHDRVYGHAALVPELQRALHTAVAPIAGIDRSILDATGWPPSATGSTWKDD